MQMSGQAFFSIHVMFCEDHMRRIPFRDNGWAEGCSFFTTRSPPGILGVINPFQGFNAPKEYLANVYNIIFSDPWLRHQDRLVASTRPADVGPWSQGCSVDAGAVKRPRHIFSKSCRFNAISMRG